MMQNLAKDPPPRMVLSSTGHRGTWVRLVPWFAGSISSALYAAHFFLGDGGSHRILDSWAYLQLSSGQPVGVPFNTRIATPAFVALVSAATGLSPPTAFELLTPAALLASLLVLGRCIQRRGGTTQWQAAVLLAFGCSLAATFGYTPILVDPTFLLLACLTIAALDGGHFGVALALACLATLTKEYGVLLGLVWLFHAYREGPRKLACLGLLLPAATLAIVVLSRQSDSAAGFHSWPAFASHLTLEYQLSVFRLRGPIDYAKLLYMWSWCALWPAVLVSVFSLLPRLTKQRRISSDEVGLAVLLTSLPVLLLGDWSRSLIILVPFACIAATAHPLARDRYFIVLLATGGLTTALARPFHSEPPPPQSLTLIMTIISVLSSLLIGVRLLRFAPSEVQPPARYNE